MVQLATGKDLSDPNTSFTQVQARQRPDVRESQLNNLITGAKVAGKVSAKNAGNELAGADVSLQEANDNARNIDNEINARLTAEQPTLDGGPLQASRVNEIKDEQLSAFASDDRTLLALRDQGTITTIEARARRQLNLKRALSNPINALFKNDFLDAAASLTGGGSGADKALFPLTAEEEQAAAVQAETNKQIAEQEASIATRSAATGIDVQVVRSELQQESLAQIELEQLNRLKQRRSLNGIELNRQNALLRGSASRGIYSKITELSTNNGGKGLTADSMTLVQRLLDQQYRGMLEGINAGATGGGAVDIGRAERITSIEDLDAWKEGMEASFKVYDATSFNAKKVEENKNFAAINNWETMPEFMVAQTASPQVADIVVMNGGFNKSLDLYLGEGAFKGLSETAAKLKGLNTFAKGAPPLIDVAGVMMSAINNGGSKDGIDYITSPEVQNNPALKVNLAKLYDMASEVSLRGYSSLDSQIAAPTNEPLRVETNDAMVAARSKIERVKDMIGAQSEVIFASPDQPETIFNRGTKGSGPLGITSKVPSQQKWILNLPDGMQEYSGDLTALHNIIRRQPWTWSHVKDDYLDGSDAFNGYMRGEWDANVSLSEPSSKPEKKSETITPSQSSSKAADSTLTIRGATPLEGDYSSIQDSTGAYNANEFVLWSKVYNTENKGEAGNKKDADRVEGILNNPTAEQSDNLSRIEETVDFVAPQAFEKEIADSGVTMDEVKSLVALTYAAETNAGTSKSQISSTGAVGAMQILPSTALSLMTKGSKPFGEQAAILTGFNRQAFIDGSPDKRKKMLLNNEQANILFSIAKYFEQIDDTKTVVDNINGAN